VDYDFLMDKLLGAWLCFLASGCAVATQITPTARSSIEQKLLVQALERAFDGLDSQLVKGKTIAVEFYDLTPDKDFARELFIAHLQSEGAIIPPIPSQAQLRLKVFAPVLAVDRGQSFIGAPSFTVPLVGFVVPEIPLFRDVKHSGQAEIKVFASDAASGAFVDESELAVGKANHDDFTVLIVIHFTRTDLEKQEWDLGNSKPHGSSRVVVSRLRLNG
jgi:hypothetical protein